MKKSRKFRVEKINYLFHNNNWMELLMKLQPAKKCQLYYPMLQTIRTRKFYPIFFWPSLTFTGDYISAIWK